MVDAANLPPDYAANASVDLVENDSDSPPPPPPPPHPPLTPPPPPPLPNQSSPSSSSSSTTTPTTSSSVSSASSVASHHQEDDDGRVFLVPYRWFRETQEQDVSSSSPSSPNSSVEARGILYSASPVNYVGPMKIINNFFNSDLIFHLQRTDDGHSDDHTLPSVFARYYALIRIDLWSHALKWHGQSDLLEETTTSSFTGDNSKDVYPVTLKISVVREQQKMAVKISKKDNTAEYFRRASKIFSVDSEPIYIWDFSGQTTLIFMNETNKLHRDIHQQSDQEILLVLYIYALSEFSLSQDGKKDDSGTPTDKKFLSPGGLLLCNGSSSKTIGDSDCISDNAVGLNGRSHKFEYLGMTGLENLGNTCFMNSAIQCLAHTPKLVDYFLGNYRKEINYDNPLGMRGELALAFGELLRKLWAPDRTPVTPRLFKTKLSHFAPQFSGFNQHDSQELLAFLLDGLHEDLNRVKHKLYVEVKDGLDRPDEEVADEYWGNHLARNDSIIVDMCQGQYRSKLVCPACNKLSVTFDPFMYLSLPLPTTSMRSMTLTVFSSDGNAKPFPCTITIPKYGNCSDMIQSLSNACSLKDDENLLVGEVYSNQIIRFLDEPLDSLSLIRDGDQLVAYRLPKDLDSSPLAVFTHELLDEQGHKTQYSHTKTFVPLVTRLPGICNGPMIPKFYMKLLSLFLTSELDQDMSNTEVTSVDVNPLVSDCATPIGANAKNSHDHILHEVKFYIIDERGVKIEFEEISIPVKDKRLHIVVCWPQSTTEKYGKSLFMSLPEVHKSIFFPPKRPPNSISLYACLDAFLKEEPLGPEDMWYCPSCKVHQQASKKLDLWRLPEFLVIHLKRFSYNRSMENKLESFVDFPIHDLDLSNYIGSRNDNEKQSICYELFAISNHYGTMRGGHYTAYVFHTGSKHWLDFDDRHVSWISEDSVKTSAAYVLFYKRVSR